MPLINSDTERLNNKGYLETLEKSECFGCEACADICNHNAIRMQEDVEGFRYPVIDPSLCVKCGLCNNVCPSHKLPQKNNVEPYVFGGYVKDFAIRDSSTSGGIFSAIANSWSKKGNYVIFGAYADRLEVYHGFIDNIKDIVKFRKSKYNQSHIENSYTKARDFLLKGKRVLFSGTPCQIAGLKKILGKLFFSDNLLTVEVVCEGSPSPLLLRKYCHKLEKKRGTKVKNLDYRFKNGNKWDFQCMKIEFEDGTSLVEDRWFSPFWVFWARRLMSRPSCIKCPFRTPQRVADITLGDLWGVHKYCPELYGGNKGATLTVCNSERGRHWFELTKESLFGHALDFDMALQFQRPMRVIVPASPDRNEFISDLSSSDYDYDTLCKKWNGKEPIKVLWNKYIWGSNRQVVAWHNLKNKIIKFSFFKSK